MANLINLGDGIGFVIDIDKDRPITIPFGKHAGTKLEDLDRGYLTWMLATYDKGRMSSGTMAYFMEDHIDLIRDLVEGAQVRCATEDTDDYQLSPSQSEASAGILEAIESGEQFIRLEGGAGYGKSFAVRDVVRNLLRTGNYYIQATAVSYVATQVLKGQLDRYKIDCGTLARTLKMDKSYDGPREVYGLSLDSAEAVFELFSPRGNKKRILIIDEYSMINDEYATYMGNAAKQYGGIIIVIGDLKQLPPVGQDTDTIFASIPCAFELTDPMRYSRDSHLYTVEQMARKNARNAAVNLDPMGTEVFVYINKDKLMDAFKTACLEHPHEDNRILFYQRQRVVDANNAVREVLFGKDAEPLMPGERLMIVRTSDCNDKRYYTGDTLDVMEVDTAPGTENLYATLGDGTTIPVLFAINENKADPTVRGGETFNAEVKRLTREAKQNEEEEKMSRADCWKPLREYKDSFVYVAYAYATTVHKSQGATVDRCFVSPRDLINIPHVGANLTYVALTRAKKELHVC